MAELRRPYFPPTCREYVVELEGRLRRLRALRYKQSDDWLARQIDKLTDGVPEEPPESGCARVHAQPDRVTEQMLDRAYGAFRLGPPGVLRVVRCVDSYPGERSDDPDAYQRLPTSINDERQALREALKAALDA